jgi:hypothetical protein
VAGTGVKRIIAAGAGLLVAGEAGLAWRWPHDTAVAVGYALVIALGVVVAAGLYSLRAGPPDV